MIELEKLINSIGVISKSGGTHKGQVGDDYAKELRRLFLSTVDTFDVIFTKFLDMMKIHYNKSKNPG